MGGGAFGAAPQGTKLEERAACDFLWLEKTVIPL